MKNDNIMKKKIWIHVGIVVAMFAVACIYMSPALNGKIIRQWDIQKAEAMSYEQNMVNKEIGSIPNWASSMFSGMPGYQIVSNPQQSVFQPIRTAVIMRPMGLERNIAVLFLYLIGFYMAMLAFGASPWIAAVGALAFGLGSYNIIIIEAGHITKAWAISMIAPILAGMHLVINSAIHKNLEPRKRKHKVLWGALLFTLALILQISFNHIQITVYTAIGCVILGLAYLIYAIIKKAFKSYLLKVGILLVCAALAFGCNARLLLVNEEYAKYTMRGGNELTVTPADLYGEGAAKAAENTANGLDIKYAFSWSYGVGETYTLLVPGAMGGGSMEPVNTDKSELVNAFAENGYQYPWGEKEPLYWGGQPMTSGPVYFGAIVMMLFLLGMIVVKGPERWWLLAASVIAILLSWGGNFMALNGWLFEHLPLYNKFRTPSMALVLANACMALMAALTLKHIFCPDNTNEDRKRMIKGLYISTGSLVAVILGVMLFGSMNFSSQVEEQWPEHLSSALRADRESLFMSDSWRSIIFILLAAATLWLYLNKKIKKSGIALAIIGVLIVVDLWGVDRRYLNSENFIEKEEVELTPQPYDTDIDAKAAQYGDKDYRVFNLAVNTFNDSEPSAFHHQIGGYSPVKLSRYQNIIDFYLGRYNPNGDLVSMEQANVSMPVLNMLNARYLVLPFKQGVGVVRNSNALGNCWFVDSILSVNNPNEEILALKDFNPATTAIVDKSKFKIQNSEFKTDSTDVIVIEHMEPYNPDHLKYRSHATSNRLAVFSEIYYAPDWFAYIDGKPADYIRVNFILRALEVPAGDHVIEFKNEAPRMHKLDTITLIISIVTLLTMVGAALLVYRKKKEVK